MSERPSAIVCFLVFVTLVLARHILHSVVPCTWWVTRTAGIASNRSIRAAFERLVPSPAAFARDCNSRIDKSLSSCVSVDIVILSWLAVLLFWLGLFDADWEIWVFVIYGEGAKVVKNTMGLLEVGVLHGLVSLPAFKAFVKFGLWPPGKRDNVFGSGTAAKFCCKVLDLLSNQVGVRLVARPSLLEVMAETGLAGFRRTPGN